MDSCRGAQGRARATNLPRIKTPRSRHCTIVLPQQAARWRRNFRYGTVFPIPNPPGDVMAAPADSVHRDAVESLSAQYSRVRALSVALVGTLAPEDTVVQSMPDVSPTKWHLAHVTWFFERFVLESFVTGYRRF